FDHAFELEQALAAKGDTVRLDAVRDPARLANIHHARQSGPLGLGHAGLCARRHIGDQPFAVLLGDDLIDPRETLLSRMLDVRERHGGSVVALMEVPPEQVHLYGCAAVEPTGDEDVVRVTGLVEKPSRRDAPSTYAVIGRYVLDPAVFDTLEPTPPRRGGAIQLTDALHDLAA
ncbi:UTP--glucose-1-phosphate uridylyltransferase, partial [Streptomyces sp. JV178]|uniref:UTP--glucose-1-phosphate uridylyltransferase n=1 Tax=Streptomyces sp. JV178 TaxID=858632 RepID=UPI000C617430